MVEQNFFSGVGLSTNKDAAKAAQEAASTALKKLGKKPILSFVLYAGNYDAKQVSKGANAVLHGTELIGGSTDSVFYNDALVSEGVLVISLFSEYLHIGVASADNASKKPYETGKAVISQALTKVPLNRYVDAYVQFNRMKKSDVSWLMKVPSFFTMLFTRGLKLDNMGNEYEIIRGIADVIGLHVPLWGGSFGTDAMKVLKGEPYQIYTLHNDKVYEDGIVALVGVSSLLYSYSMEHGCKATPTTGFISKTSNHGFIVEEISNMPVVDWYAKQLNMPVEAFIKDARILTQLNPLGIPDTLGNYTIRGGGIPFGKSLGYVAPLQEGWPVVLMKGDAENLMHASADIQNDFAQFVGKDKKPKLALVTQCVTRKLVFGENTKKELAALKKSLGCDIAGFTCFGETGAKQGHSANFHHVTLNVFAIYDLLLSKL